MRTSLSIISACLMLVGVVGCINGCGTPIRTAYVAEGSLIVTVDKAMEAWRDYANGTNGVTQAQIDTVKQAYLKYYAAQMSAKIAVETYFAFKTADNSNAVVQITAGMGQSAAAVLAAITQNSQGRVQ